MILLAGVEYGRAAEIAATLGPDVTIAMVRAWDRRGLLDRHHIPGQGRGAVWYRYDQAATVERDARQSSRGRPRRAAS